MTSLRHCIFNLLLDALRETVITGSTAGDGGENIASCVSAETSSKQRIEGWRMDGECESL